MVVTVGPKQETKEFRCFFSVMFVFQKLHIDVHLQHVMLLKTLHKLIKNSLDIYILCFNVYVETCVCVYVCVPVFVIFLFVVLRLPIIGTHYSNF